MPGLVIRDIFALRKKIYLMGAVMAISNIILLIITAAMKKNNSDTILDFFKCGILVTSFIGIICVFMMVSIVSIDKSSGWNRMIMAFPISGFIKAGSRYISFLILTLVSGIYQFLLTIIMFKMMKFDIKPSMVKYIFTPFALGLLFIFVRLIFEYTSNRTIAVQNCVIMAVFVVASSVIIYKFGGYDFPQKTLEIIDIFMNHFNRWLVLINPCVMLGGILVTSGKLVKQKK